MFCSLHDVMQIFTEERECMITSPLRVSPFHNTGAVNPPTYAFRGVCEHIFAKTCDGERFTIVGDFLSEDLSTGRIGLQIGDNEYIINEDLTVESDDTLMGRRYAGGVEVMFLRFGCD